MHWVSFSGKMLLSPLLETLKGDGENSLHYPKWGLIATPHNTIMPMLMPMPHRSSWEAESAQLHHLRKGHGSTPTPSLWFPSIDDIIAGAVPSLPSDCPLNVNAKMMARRNSSEKGGKIKQRERGESGKLKPE